MQRIAKLIINKNLSILRDTRGASNILIAFLISAIALPLTGVVVDGGRLFYVRTDAKYAIDAALVAAASAPVDQQAQEMRDVFLANFGPNARRQDPGETTRQTSGYSYTLSGPTVRRVGRDLHLTSNAVIVVPTYFSNIFSTRSTRISVTSEVTYESERSLEMVLALDNTGSMCTFPRPAGATPSTPDQIDPQCKKAEAMRGAAKRMTNQLKQAFPANKLAMGVVPFTATVNVGRSDWTSLPPTGGWGGCYYKSNDDITFPAAPNPEGDYSRWLDNPATIADADIGNLAGKRWEPILGQLDKYYCYIMDPGSISWLQTNPPHNRDPITGAALPDCAPTSGCPVGMCKTRYRYPLYSEPQYDTALSCPRRIQPLTRNIQLVSDLIDSMHTSYMTSMLGAWTRQSLGVLWGYRMLAPANRGQWGPSGGDGSLPASVSEDVKKVVVLFTDGRPTETRDIPMQGRPVPFTGDFRRPLNTTTLPVNCIWRDGRQICVGASPTHYEDVFDDLAKVCNRMKADGIEIYTILFQENDFASQQLLQFCATDARHYFFLPQTPGNTDYSELDEAFGEVVRQLTDRKIRLVK